MENDITKVDKYEPTADEVKLLEVFCNPEHKHINITDKCKLAETSRTTYYKALKKEGFRNLLKTTALDLVITGLMPIINATIDFGLKYKECAADRKVILQMANMITEKFESKNENANVNTDITNLSPEDRKLRIDELLNKRDK